MSKQYGSTPSDGALSFGNEEEASFRENLDPEQLVRLQINRCNIAHSSGDEQLFNNSVLSLLALLPSTKREELEAEKESYTREEDDYEYVERGGWKLGTPKRPVYGNIPGSWNYDPYLKGTKIEFETVKKINEKTGLEEEYEVECEVPTVGEPYLISPIPIKKPVIDYYKLFVLIIGKIESTNMWFRAEQVNEEAGKIPEDKKTIQPATPTLASYSDKKKTQEEDEDE